jgi:N utilization substance protein A
MQQQGPRTEFSQALKALSAERGLDSDVILETVKQAIIAAYKKDAKEQGIDVDSFEYDAVIDPVSGETKVFAWLSDDPDNRKDVTPPGFGRIATQTAKQVIHQKIREAEKGAIMDDYAGRIGSLISGLILRFEGSDVRVDLGRTEGVMPSDERIPNERLSLGQRLTFLLKDIVDTPRGKQIVLSRADPLFVQKLFEREVPEISSGSVVVKAMAREPGIRTKMAVDSTQSGVDPVGSCVGQKGVRVQTVTDELGGERIDVIQWTDNIADFIKASLSPAEGLVVELDEKNKTAVVKSPEDQLSLAIGRDGQNARLTAKITGWKIKIDEVKGLRVGADTKPVEASVESPKPKEEKLSPAHSVVETGEATQEVSEELPDQN